MFSNKCAACHSVKGVEPGPVGPNLAEVVGRMPGVTKGFVYSDAMRTQRQRWTPERLDWFLTDPLAAVPGTSMSFTGLKSAAARADVICYLVNLGRTAR
ncbi:MAG: c-type cytochrome [Proteobacteria bacterium]|nr:c-type cytochrome [Pseudomonadota bacterium]